MRDGMKMRIDWISISSIRVELVNRAEWSLIEIFGAIVSQTRSHRWRSVPIPVSWFEVVHLHRRGHPRSPRYRYSATKHKYSQSGYPAASSTFSPSYIRTPLDRPVFRPTFVVALFFRATPLQARMQNR